MTLARVSSFLAAATLVAIATHGCGELDEAASGRAGPGYGAGSSAGGRSGSGGTMSTQSTTGGAGAATAGIAGSNAAAGSIGVGGLDGTEKPDASDGHGGTGGLGAGDGSAGSGGRATDGGTLDVAASGADADKVSFAAIGALLASSCATAGCHGNNGGTRDVDLRNNAGFYNRLVGNPPGTVPSACRNRPLAVPGMPAQSLLVAMVEANAAARMGCAARMPDNCPTQRPCWTAEQIQMLKDWIAAGAPNP